MHQLLCGADETIVIDGYWIQVLRVTQTEVRFGISTRGNDGRVHEIRVPRGVDARRVESTGELVTR